MKIKELIKQNKKLLKDLENNKNEIMEKAYELKEQDMIFEFGDKEN